MGRLALEATSVGDVAKESGKGRAKKKLWRGASLGRSGVWLAHSRPTHGARDSLPPLLTPVQRDGLCLLVHSFDDN